MWLSITKVTTTTLWSASLNLLVLELAVKLRWFQEQLEEGKRCYDHIEVVAMVER
jgi:hypothetical protein